MNIEAIKEAIESMRLGTVDDGSDTIWIRPKEITNDVCFEFNHLSDEEQSKILQVINPFNKIALVHPCQKSECFVDDAAEGILHAYAKQDNSKTQQLTEENRFKNCIRIVFLDGSDLFSEDKKSVQDYHEMCRALLDCSPSLNIRVGEQKEYSIMKSSIRYISLE